MSDENAAPLPVINIEIERNGVKLVTKTAKSRSGLVYPKIDLSPVPADQLMTFFGDEIIRQKLQQFINLTAQATIENVTNEGKIPFTENLYEKFAENLAKLTVRGETLGDLEDRVADLTAQMIEISEGSDQSPDAFMKLAKIATEIKGTNALIAEKKERYKRDKAAGKPVEEAA